MTTMKNIMLMLMASAALCSAQSYHYVNPYIRQNGTYVPGHYQTNPNRNPYDNWSSYPNTNPFTGRQRTIHVMPRSTYGGGYRDAYGLYHY